MSLAREKTAAPFENEMLRKNDKRTFHEKRKQFDCLIIFIANIFFLNKLLNFINILH